MLANIPNPTNDQQSQIQAFANALKSFVESATITLVTSSVLAPAGTAGGPCTQSGPTIGTLS